MNLVQSQSDVTASRYAAKRIETWENIARQKIYSNTILHKSYHKYLQKLYHFFIPENQRILELGCGNGNLLASLKPSLGVGVDFSPTILNCARSAHPELHFIEYDAHFLKKDIDPDILSCPFDAIILSDLVNDSWDVYELLVNCRQFCGPSTRLFINFHSHLWEHIYKVLQNLKLVTPRLQQNWLTSDDMNSLFTLAGFRLIVSRDEYLCPFPIPGLETLCNRYLAKLWPFSLLDIFHIHIARPEFIQDSSHSVSVIIPARNEAGNIESAILRTPEMGSGTELIFVEGNSTDNTWSVMQEMTAKYSQRNIKILQQPGKGKGDAVRCGFEAATGDILMILDADLTMPPETLPQFYEAITSGKAELVNGVRLVYPQEKEAMRFFNLVGNKFFSLAFSWLLERKIKDTLCGTKVISREWYKKLAANRLYFGDFDPFGDFDLLFGAAKLNLEIKDLPVRYRERVYGETNISRWRDGWILLKMTCLAAHRIKFVP